MVSGRLLIKLDFIEEIDMDIRLLSKSFFVRRLDLDDVDIIYDISCKNEIFYKYHPPFVRRICFTSM